MHAGRGLTRMQLANVTLALTVIGPVQMYVRTPTAANSTYVPVRMDSRAPLAPPYDVDRGGEPADVVLLPARGVPKVEERAADAVPKKGDAG